MERKSRSQSYQYILNERLYGSEVWNSLDQMQSLRAYQERIDTLRYQMETLINLDGDLWKEMWNLIDTQCSLRQKQVAHLLYEGKTQMEIAAKLGVNQSSICKTISGNSDYRVDKEARRYGGLAKKLSKLIPFSGEAHRIMSQMYGLSETGETPTYICFRKTFRTHREFSAWIARN